jgi:hypothetical protein
MWSWNISTGFQYSLLHPSFLQKRMSRKDATPWPLGWEARKEARAAALEPVEVRRCASFENFSEGSLGLANSIDVSTSCV